MDVGGEFRYPEEEDDPRKIFSGVQGSEQRVVAFGQ